MSDFSRGVELAHVKLDSINDIMYALKTLFLSFICFFLSACTAALYGDVSLAFQL